MADIFISYAREDGERARKLAEALEHRGWSVWWDPDIHPGETWDDVIERELDAARCVTVLWSTRSIQKEWVRVEATDGLDRRILVPALIEDVRPPLRFRQVQAASLVDWNGEDAHRGFQRLLKALSAKLGAPSQPQTPKAAPVAKKPAKARTQPTVKKPAGPEDLPDLAVFRDMDEPWCPEMVVVPAGEFMMGSPDTNYDALENERPWHKVTITCRTCFRIIPAKLGRPLKKPTGFRFG